MKNLKWLLIPLTTAVKYGLIAIIATINNFRYKGTEGDWGLGTAFWGVILFFVMPVLLSYVVKEKKNYYGFMAFLLNIGVALTIYIVSSL
jgi:membrane protease YdiL (CAAX protease family)